MDLADLRLEVRERVNELTADFYTTDEVDRAINEGIRRFAAEEPWPFLVTEWTSSIAAATTDLDLPSDISLTRVFNITISGDNLITPRSLERVTPQEGFRLRQTYFNRTGSPRYYYITKSNLPDDEAPPTIYTAKVIPTTDAEYDVEAQYMAVPTVLTGEYQEAIVAWATGKLFLKELAISQKANEQFGIYRMVLDQARKDLKGFNIDETVAWGREQPLPRYRMQPRVERIPPTLG